MDWRKKLRVWTVGTTLLCGGALLTGCGEDAQSPRPDQARERPATRRSRGRAEATPSSTIDLASLLTEVPEYQGSGRNLFAFGQERRVVQAPPPVTAPTGTTTVPAAAVRNSPSTPPARIDLQFAGFVEKKEPGGTNKKYAVFLDGEEILTGAEGDLVGNRYKVVEIGLESATVALEGSQVTQKIPLRTN
jgi:hypothetical protein